MGGGLSQFLGIMKQEITIMMVQIDDFLKYQLWGTARCPI